MLLAKWELEDELHAIESTIGDARMKNVDAKKRTLLKEDPLPPELRAEAAALKGKPGEEGLKPGDFRVGRLKDDGLAGAIDGAAIPRADIVWISPLKSDSWQIRPLGNVNGSPGRPIQIHDLGSGID